MMLRRLFALLSFLLLTSCATRQEPPQEASTEPERPGWMPPPLTSLPYSSRVGIMNALPNELAHVHAGTAGSGNFRHTYATRFDLPAYVSESLRKAMLKHTPYQPLIVRPSARLLRDYAVWQDSWDEQSGRFGGPWQQEFDAIIKQNQLKMLVIISAAEIDDGIVGTGQTLLGSGLYTRNFLGKRQAAVFSTVRFYRVLGSPGKLVTPVTSPADRLYADIKDFPVPEPVDQLSEPTLNPVRQAVKDLLDQKTGAFISLMK